MGSTITDDDKRTEEFDCDDSLGPRMGMTRMERFERHQKMGTLPDKYIDLVMSWSEEDKTRAYREQGYPRPR